SRLSLDPPGRVFRCPRCQAKLGSGAAWESPADRAPSPSDHVAASRGPARSGACANSSWAGYPARSGWGDRRSPGLGRDPGRVAATAVTSPSCDVRLTSGADDDLEEWLDRLP